MPNPQIALFAALQRCPATPSRPLAPVIGGLLANDSYAVVALASSHFAMLAAASP